jgi:plasmid stabilization system protein ParE
MAHAPFHVILTNKALVDLQDLAHYVREDSPQNAVGVATMILEAIDSLGSMPKRFRRVRKSRKRGSMIHAMVVRPFIIYYRVDERSNSVQVCTIRHGAQRQPRRFG